MTNRPPGPILAPIETEGDTVRPIMHPIPSYRQSSVFFSIRTERMMEREQYVPDHVLIHVLAGRIEITDAEAGHLFEKGETAFVRRNLLARFVKHPAGDREPFRAVSIFLKQPVLRDYYTRHRLDSGNDAPPSPRPNIRAVPHTPLLKAFFASLTSCFDMDAALRAELADIKSREALILLLQSEPTLAGLLFSFTEPGKIDLEEFMCKHFMFNVPLTTFSRMTGRSLSTFKRDFGKVFAVPPSRWLKKKRLEMAHYLIKEKRRPPSNVYLEVGFENLSHFSSSFKAVYGYNPSALHEPHNKVSLSLRQ